METKQLVYKYTKDGKKVVVIGKLNNAEYIVQEIFISNGQEMPGGENFVTSGLLDAPSKSWKQKEVEKYEQEYDVLRAKLENIRNTERYESAFTTAVQKRLSSYCDVEAIEQLLAFLNNEIEYIVKDGKIITMLDGLTQKRRYGGFDNLKLLTLFGDRKCGLTWRLNLYSDGSGGCGSKVYPARNFEYAKQHLESQIKAKEQINDSDIKAQEEYGLQYPSKSQLRKYRQYIIKNKRTLIKNTEVTLATQKKELEGLKR